MDEKERRKHAYLGDAVYAEWNGYGICLRTNHHTDEQCHNKIYIEPDVLENLNQFYKFIIKEYTDEYDRVTGNTGLLDEEIPQHLNNDLPQT